MFFHNAIWFREDNATDGNVFPLKTAVGRDSAFQIAAFAPPPEPALPYRTSCGLRIRLCEPLSGRVCRGYPAADPAVRSNLAALDFRSMFKAGIAVSRFYARSEMAVHDCVRPFFFAVGKYFPSCNTSSIYERTYGSLHMAEKCGGNIMPGSIEPAPFSEEDNQSCSHSQHETDDNRETPLVFQKGHGGKIHAVKSGNKGQRHEDGRNNGQDAKSLLCLFACVGVGKLHEFSYAFLNSLQTAKKMIVRPDLLHDSGTDGFEGFVSGQQVGEEGERK